MNKGATDSLVEVSKPSEKKHAPTTLDPLSDKNSPPSTLVSFSDQNGGQSTTDPRPSSNFVPLSDQNNSQHIRKTSSTAERSTRTKLPIKECVYPVVLDSLKPT